MKFNVATKQTTTVGDLSTKKITLSANAKAFKLIFGQIYPDIIKAIVRELFTNAWDSQKSAKNLETPIEIHIPTSWEPFFSIRDYGTGMTPSIIEEVYSKIFESTKDQSDDEAGMFGMGSKTPLGYTDTFSVTSYVNGTFWHYNIFMDETSSPAISLMATGETDEPNGVEVSVGVEEKDFETFKNHVQFFALGANTPVNINRERFLQKYEVLYSGANWQLLKKNVDRYQNNTQIRMGCVLYTLNYNLVRSYISNIMQYSELQKFESFTKQPFVLDFDIGEFDVTGSREDIIYNAESAKKIADRLIGAVDEIRSNVQNEINNAETYGKAWTIFVNYKEMRFHPNNPVYGALELKQYVGNRFKNISIYKNPWKNVKYKADGKTNLNLEEFEGKYQTYNGKSVVVTNYFILENVTENVQNVNKRFANFHETKDKAGHSYSRKSSYGRNHFNVWHVIYKDERQLKRLYAMLPDAHCIFIDIKDIEPKERAKRQKVETYTSRFLNRNGKYADYEPTYSWTELEDDTYYVTAERRSIDSTRTDIELALKTLNVEMKDVAVIGKSQRYLIDKLNLKDLVGEYKKVVDSIRYNRDTMNKAVVETYTNRYNSLYHSFWAKEKFRDEHFSAFLFDESKVELDTYMEINDAVHGEYKTLCAEFEKIVDDFIVSEPIFKFIEPHRIANDYEELKLVIERMN